MSRRLSPIYKRDLATLLPRRVIDKMRQISRSFEGSLMAVLSKLPRPKFHCLSIFSDEDGTFDERGFETTPYEGTQRSWVELTEFSDCCHDDIEPFASQITGQLIVVNQSDTTVIDLELGWTGDDDEQPETPDTPDTGAHLVVANRLTKETACAFLHMLSHIEGHALDFLYIDVYLGAEGQIRPMINNRLLDALSSLCGQKFRIYADEAQKPYLKPWEKRAEMSRMMIHDAAQFAKVKRITAEFQNFQPPLGRGTKLEEVRLLIGLGGRQCKKLLLYSGETVDFLDAIIELLQTTPDFAHPDRMGQIELFFGNNELSSRPGEHTALAQHPEKAFRREVLPDDWNRRAGADKSEAFCYQMMNVPSGKFFIISFAICEGRNREDFIDQHGELVPAGTLFKWIPSVEIDLH